MKITKKTYDKNVKKFAKKATDNWKKLEYVIYNDGLEVKRFDDWHEAQDYVNLYDGDHDVWYEAEEVEVED